MGRKKTQTEEKVNEVVETAKAEVKEFADEVEAKVEAEVDKAEVIVKSNKTLFAIVGAVALLVGIFVGALIF